MVIGPRLPPTPELRENDVTTWTAANIIRALGPFLDSTTYAFDSRALMLDEMISTAQRLNEENKTLTDYITVLEAENEELDTWKFAAMAMGTLLVLLVLLGVSYALSSSLRTYVHAVPRYVYSRMQ